MSIRHPELVELVYQICVDRVWGGAMISEDDLAPLVEDAEAEYVVEDRLGSETVETVNQLTGSDDVWLPQRAARHRKRGLNTSAARRGRVKATRPLWARAGRQELLSTSP
jgi:hypothetical protein